MNHMIVCASCQVTNRVPSEKLTDHPVCGKCKAKLFQRVPMETSGLVFQKHITRSTLPVVVDFWAPWCGPCKMMTPVFKDAAAQLEPRFRLIKLNTQDDQQAAAQYGIQSIPTLALFKNGQEVKRQAGAMNLQSLISWITAG